MKITEWIELACNKLGSPVMSYAPQVAMKEYEDRIQEVTKILHEVLVVLKDQPKPTCEHEWELNYSTGGALGCWNCYQCKICGEQKNEAVRTEPKPERIELLGNLYDHPCSKDERMWDKINEIINHLTRGKGA